MKYKMVMYNLKCIIKYYPMDENNKLFTEISTRMLLKQLKNHLNVRYIFFITTFAPN